MFTQGFESMTRWAISIGLVIATASAATANGYGESAPWQFETPGARAVNAAVLDLIEKKRGGYYDSFKSTNYNTSNTYIRQQTNCTVASSASGNSGSNGVSAATSSPTVTNGASTSSGTTGNGATSTLGAGDPFGTVGALGLYGTGTSGATGNWATGLGPGVTGSVQTSQSNAGSILASGVSGSSTTSASGAIGANGGFTSQALNSAQTNNGAQTSSVNGSTACAGYGGPLN